MNVLFLKENFEKNRITKSMSILGTIVSDGNQLKLDFKFPVTHADFKVSIPTIVFKKIAEVVDVSDSITLVKNNQHPQF